MSENGTRIKNVLNKEVDYVLYFINTYICGERKNE